MSRKAKSRSSVSENQEPETKPETIEETPAQETPKDERAPFVPRSNGDSNEKQSVTVPLKDGKLDLESLSDKRVEKLRVALSTPEARRKLGLVQGQPGEAGITIKTMGPLFGALGVMEGIAVSFSAKIPRDVAISIMMFNDVEFAKVAPLAAAVLERSAPAWLRKMLLSENAEIGQLVIALFQIHQSKLEQIKQWKLENQSGRQPEPIPAVN
jgi:hypothetical protein